MEQWSEAYELAQSAALRDDGWWPTAVKRALEHSLYDSPNGLPRPALIKKTLKILHSEDSQSISSALDELISTGSVLNVNLSLHLKEGRRRELASENEYQSGIRKKVERLYEVQCVELQNSSFQFPTWNTFHDGLIVPIISELGARTIKLLNGETSPAETRVFDRFARKYAPRNRNELKHLCSKFFNPHQADVRTFLTGKLSGYFLASAGAVSKKALKAFAETVADPPEFQIVLDTNTIFSILDWHDNPANEISRSLFELGNDVSNYINVRFYVLPETLQEARRALQGACDSCPFDSLTVEQAKALHMTGDLSGLLERYAKAAQIRPQTAKEYFREKIAYIETRITGLGIHKLDDDLSDLADSSKVERRTNSLSDLSKKWRKNRSRASIRHDVLVASYVESRRPGKHPLVHEAKWWFLTVDASLRKWERSEMAAESQLPCTILPDELVQILRFWVPRSDELDEALMEGIRLEFEFFDYDNQAQATSISILGTLSEVAHGDELSVDATLKILLDKNVRAIFEKESASEAELTKVIEISAVTRIAELEEQLKFAREKANENLNDSMDEMPVVMDSGRKNGRKKSGVRVDSLSATKVEDTNRELREERARRQNAETRLKKISDEKVQAEGNLEEAVRQLQEESNTRKDFIRKQALIFACVILVVIVIAAGYLWGKISRGTDYLQLVALVVLGVSVCMKILPAASDKYLINPHWKIRKFCDEHRMPLTYAIVGGVCGVLASSFL